MFFFFKSAVVVPQSGVGYALCNKHKNVQVCFCLIQEALSEYDWTVGGLHCFCNSMSLGLCHTVRQIKKLDIRGKTKKILPVTFLGPFIINHIHNIYI